MRILDFNPYIKRLFGNGTLLCGACKSSKMTKTYRVGTYVVEYQCQECHDKILYNSHPNSYQGSPKDIQRMIRDGLRETKLKQYQN